MSEEHDDFYVGPRASDIPWKIGLKGRAWDNDEFEMRADLRPEKLEIWDGKLLFSNEERLLLAGLLVENIGAAQIVRLGGPQIWRAAVETLDRS